MDVFDQAQANDELFRQVALSRHFAGRKINPLERPKPGDALISGASPGGGRTNVAAGRDKGGRGEAPAVARTCSDCGEEIEPARLTALPYAVRCIGCQQKKERRDKDGLD